MARLSLAPEVSSPDTALVVEQIRWIVGSGDRQPHGAGRWGAALPLLAVALAIPVFLGGRWSAENAAPPSAPADAPERRASPPPVDRSSAVPSSVPERATPVAATPTPPPRAFYVSTPRQVPPIDRRPAVARARAVSRPVEGVDGGNGAVAVHLTGEALRIALEKDSALTKRLNEAELRRSGPAPSAGP